MRYRNGALFVTLAAIWGSGFTAIKAGLAYFPPVLFAAFRYDVAGGLMLAYAWWRVDRWRPRTRAEWLVVGVSGSLMIAGYQAFLFVGEQGTTGAAAATIVSLNPILTTAFARGLLPDERLSALGIVGLLLGFAGVAVLSDPDPGNLLAGNTLSEGLIVLAVTSFALGSVVIQRVETALTVEAMEAWALAVGAVLLHVASLGLGEAWAAVRWTAEAWAALLYLAAVASAVGFLIYFDLLDRLGPVEINLVSYAVPPAAALTGFLLLGERLGARGWLGFLLILAGFVLVKRRALRNEVRRRLA